MLTIFGFLFLLNFIGFIFWIWMIVDCVTKEPSQGNDKVIWVLIIVLLGWIGALVYFFARRQTRIDMHSR